MECERIEWPYPIHYGSRSVFSTDVLVLGGGIAGAHAAIAAARRGAKVTLVEKGSTKWSGSGGAGVDHWQAACLNPCCRVSPEELTVAVVESLGGYECGIKRYIQCVESYEVLLDLERMGLKIRDNEDEFKGAEFRDEQTKLLFAYDYRNRYTIRVWGRNVKPILHRALLNLGVSIFDRTMVTKILTQRDGDNIAALGAVGINTRTGEILIFLAKAIVLCIPEAEGLWDYAEPHGFGRNFHDPNCRGDGLAMAWDAGVKLTLLEKTLPSDGIWGYIPYSVGNAHNTWHGCSIVDSEGKEVDWVDRDGKKISYEARFMPADNQNFFIDGGSIGDPRNLYRIHPPGPDPALPERILRGDFVLPLYADLTSISPQERKCIYGVMVGNEGKTWVLKKTFDKYGFDPQRHLLQVPIFAPDEYTQPPVWWYSKLSQKHRRIGRGAGVLVDWDLGTNVKGLYAAGSVIYGHGDHAGAATSGRYAGRKAAEEASNKRLPVLSREIESQVNEHAEFIYSFIRRRDGLTWKDLALALNRIMQDYCGPYKHERSLNLGLRLLQKIRDHELEYVCARNPRELVRTLEVYSLLRVGEAVFWACLARKASSKFLNFYRIDYPSVDPPEWHKLFVVSKLDGKVFIEDLPTDYYLKDPYLPSYEENYRSHASRE